MGWRFRRTLRLGSFLRLNLGLRGLSVSAGPRGAHLTHGPAGVTASVGLPGTGLSYREHLRGK